MDFEEALEKLADGNYMSREAWGNEYIANLPGMPFIWKIYAEPSPNAANWACAMEDFESDDWYVYREVEVGELSE